MIKLISVVRSATLFEAGADGVICVLREEGMPRVEVFVWLSQFAGAGSRRQV